MSFVKMCRDLLSFSYLPIIRFSGGMVGYLCVGSEVELVEDMFDIYIFREVAF